MRLDLTPELIKGATYRTSARPTYCGDVTESAPPADTVCTLTRAEPDHQGDVLIQFDGDDFEMWIAADCLIGPLGASEAKPYPPQSGTDADAVEPSTIARLIVEVQHLAERQAESDIAVLSLAGTVAELAARVVRGNQ